MYELVSCGMETITPKKAAELLEYNNYVSQRRLNEGRAAALAEKMTDGRWRTGEIALASNGKGTWVLMNGQKQLRGVLLSGKTVRAKVERFHCPTAADEALLFRQFDEGGVRTIAQMAKAEADALGITWPPRIVALVVAAADLDQDWGRIMSVSRDMAEGKVDRLKHVMLEGEFIARLFSRSNANQADKHLRRAPVVAAMMRTWGKAHADAETFWLRVRDREMLAKSDPEYKLAEFLMTNGPRVGWSGLPQNRRVTPHEFLYRCIGAWNAFRRGEKPNGLKYFSDKPVPRCV